MANNENLIPIPGRLHSVATEGHVSGADEIYDDTQQKDQETINSELIAAVGTGDSVDSRIAAAKAEIIGNATSACDTLGEAEALISAETNARQSAISNVIGDAATDYNTLGKLEDKIQAEASRAEGAESALDGRVDTLEEAVGTGGSVDERIAEAVENAAFLGANDGSETIADFDPQADSLWKGAQVLSSAEKAQVKTNLGLPQEIYSKTEVNNLITTPNQQYITVATYASLPASGSADTIYRVSNYNGSTSQVDPTMYSEYAWNGIAYEFLCVKSQVGEVFDISAYNSNTKYADLAAALGTNGANVPEGLRKGGMSVKFVSNSDNKYAQYRLMAHTFSTIESDWQGVDIEPTALSRNLVESGGVWKETSSLSQAIDLVFVPQAKNIEQGTYWTGAKSPQNACLRTTDKLPVIPGSVIYIRTAQDITIRISEFGQNNSYIQQTGYISVQEFKVSSDTYYITIAALYSSRGFGDENPVSTSDYIEGDFDVMFPKSAEITRVDEKIDAVESETISTINQSKYYIKTNVSKSSVGRGNISLIGTISFDSTVSLCILDYIKVGKKVTILLGENLSTGYYSTYDSSKNFIHRYAIPNPSTEIILPTNCEYIRLQVDYSGRGFSENNIVKTSDYRDGDIVLISEFSADDSELSVNRSERGWQEVTIINGTCNNPNNINAVSVEKIVDASKWKKAKIITDRPVDTGCEYRYSGNTYNVPFGHAYAAAVGSTNNRVRELPFLDDNELALASSEVGIAFNIFEYNSTTGDFRSLRVSDFNGYHVFICCSEGYNVSGYLSQYIVPTSPVPDILKINNRFDIENWLLQLKRPNRQEETTPLSSTSGVLSLLHLSDIHGDIPNIERMLDFKNYYHNYISDVLHTGDSVFYKYSHDNPFDLVDGAGNVVLNTIGNHDAQDEDGLYTKTEAECFSKYFNSYISSWGVTSGGTNKCYYYKDYTTAGIRLIVLDCMHYDTTQETWFEDTLSSAITNELAVIVASHYYCENGISLVDCSFSPAIGMFTLNNGMTGYSDRERLPDSAADVVDDFITGGGHFISWICGHTHIDCFGVLNGHTDQTVIVITNAGNYNTAFKDIYNSSARVVGTKSQDAFNVVTFDKVSKLIRILRIGADSDLFMRSVKTLCYNYNTKTLISNN